MAWPQLDEFRGAIQNPPLCFADPQLKVGRVVEDTLGLPKVASGNYACAYEVVSGGTRWAVRTFSREVTDHQRRYRLISEYLETVGLPWMVKFQYVPQGILVRGNWYPIVKMSWVEGMTLTRWIKQNRHRADLLYDLAKGWRGMVGALSGLQMAHADLQQGNVFVTPSGELKLIDYDGMYVPAMRGEKAPELGHPNWNHPRRTSDLFGPYLDQFPGLVGYVSLLAVAKDPALLDRYCSDDNIVLSQTDLADPLSSRAFQDLRRIRDPLLNRLTDVLMDWCNRAIDFKTLEEAAGTGLPAARPGSVVTAPVRRPLPAGPAPLPKSPFFELARLVRLAISTAWWSELQRIVAKAAATVGVIGLASAVLAAGVMVYQQWPSGQPGRDGSGSAQGKGTSPQGLRRPAEVTPNGDRVRPGSTPAPQPSPGISDNVGPSADGTHQQERTEAGSRAGERSTNAQDIPASSEQSPQPRVGREPTPSASARVEAGKERTSATQGTELEREQAQRSGSREVVASRGSETGDVQTGALQQQRDAIVSGLQRSLRERGLVDLVVDVDEHRFVTLTGRVAQDKEVETALTIARGYPGVAGVHSKIINRMEETKKAFGGGQFEDQVQPRR